MRLRFRRRVACAPGECERGRGELRGVGVPPEPPRDEAAVGGDAGAELGLVVRRQRERIGERRVRELPVAAPVVDEADPVLERGHGRASPANAAAAS